MNGWLYFICFFCWFGRGKRNSLLSSYAIANLTYKTYRVKQKVKTMALIKCKECLHQVSDKANICPSCGVKISKNLSFFQVVSGLSLGILVIYLYNSDVQKEKMIIQEPITQTTPLKQITVSEQPIQPEIPALKAQQSEPELTIKTDKNKTWTGDWGNGIIATVSSQPCGNIQLTNEDYDYLMTVSIPVTRLKNPADAWQVLDDRAVTITGCWSKRDWNMIHAKLTRKKGNKTWEQDFKLDDGNWTSQDEVHAPSKEQALIDYKDACSKNYKVCKDNTDIINLNSNASVEIKVGCKRAAEEKAVSTIDWGGILSPNFGSFRPGDSGIKEDKIFVIDKVAMYQNQFGAMIKKETICLFNLKTNEVEQLLVAE